MDQYASAVLDHISTTIDSVTTQKQITMYPNQKPWMNREVRLLLKARNTAFRSGDTQAYSTARAELKRGIIKAKHHYKRKVEDHFSNSNPRRMWQGLQIITDYRAINPTLASSDVSFLNELNNFYARFERGNPTTATRADVSAEHQSLTLSPTEDPHQFAYCQNRSTEDAVSIALHSVLSHLDNKNTSVRMLFIDFSSAFNTVIPSQLITKLTDLGISSHMCNWLLDFLTNRPQHVRMDNHCSSTITINTGVPQGCVISPFLFSLFTHDCKPVNDSNIIIKFADDTTVIGLIKDSDEAAYREEVDRLAEWCDTNNLLLNAEKTKEIIVDFRRNADSHPPLHIKGTAVERVNSFKFLGVHISEDLTWTTSCSKLVKKAHQRLFFLRTLRRNQLSSDILVNFYRCTIESILTNCITAWYGCCSATDRKALQRVVKAAQRITGTPLPAIEDIYRKRYLDQYASAVLDHISTTIDSVTTQKQITMYPNQKPWMNREVRLLLKARNTAFRSGDTQAYSTARAELKRGIIKAKHHYKRKVEDHFSNSNPRPPSSFSLFTHDCKPVNDSNIIIKFADDTTVIGLIKDSDEAAYREEVDGAWLSGATRITFCSTLRKPTRR
ncbi:hypothetical protein NFI96_012457 [Prochilodus magdalenae]|nr:hypothetical protein NFI96_012457 [Prochilodus magdalenae]